MSRVTRSKNRKIDEFIVKNNADPELQKEKTQVKVVKPRKYKKKTYEQIKRIEKSKRQKIYLLKAEKKNQPFERWIFQVLGTTGSIHHITVQTTVQCTCPDFKFKRKPCKHIYFIVTQVAQSQQILDYFKNDNKISQNAYHVLSQRLEERLKSRMGMKQNSKQKKQIDLKDDIDCAICFIQMEKQQQQLDDCGTCNKYFHVDCIKMWKARNPTCPLCRSDLVVIKKEINIGDEKDPLGKIRQIKI